MSADFLRRQYKCWYFTLIHPTEEEINKVSKIPLLDFTVFYSLQIIPDDENPQKEMRILRGMIWNTLGHYSRMDTLRNLISTRACFQHLEQPKASYYRYIDKFGNVEHN